MVSDASVMYGCPMPAATKRDQYMDERRRALGMSWEEVGAAAHVSRDTLRRIRYGGDAYPRTIRNLEAVLGWKLGSIARIDDGREPITLDVDPAALLPPPDLVGPARAGDPAAQLRQLRDQMGAVAFWREVGAMQAEDEMREASGH